MDPFLACENCINMYPQLVFIIKVNGYIIYINIPYVQILARVKFSVLVTNFSETQL